MAKVYGAAAASRRMKLKWLAKARRARKFMSRCKRKMGLGVRTSHGARKSASYLRPPITSPSRLLPAPAHVGAGPFGIGGMFPRSNPYQGRNYQRNPELLVVHNPSLWSGPSGQYRPRLSVRHMISGGSNPMRKRRRSSNRRKVRGHGVTVKVGRRRYSWSKLLGRYMKRFGARKGRAKARRRWSKGHKYHLGKRFCNPLHRTRSGRFAKRGGRRSRRGRK